MGHIHWFIEKVTNLKMRKTRNRFEDSAALVRKMSYVSR
jgi:hypothetical protein